jgi:hypothetical protein
MRSKRADSYYYENFEFLNNKRLSWKEKRNIKGKRMTPPPTKRR